MAGIERSGMGARSGRDFHSETGGRQPAAPETGSDVPEPKTQNSNPEPLTVNHEFRALNPAPWTLNRRPVGAPRA